MCIPLYKLYYLILRISSKTCISYATRLSRARHTDKNVRAQLMRLSPQKNSAMVPGPV